MKIVENGKSVEHIEKKCKVCGLGVIEHDFAICNYCGWEADDLQNNEPDYIGGANEMSLNQYKQFWNENKEDLLKHKKDLPYYAFKKSEEYYEKTFKKQNEEYYMTNDPLYYEKEKIIKENCLKQRSELLKKIEQEKNNKTEEQIQYEEEKCLKKLKLVRNEFKTVGNYHMPLIKKQNIDLDKIDLWCYSKTKVNDDENKDKTIHFFTYDWLFEKVYDNPEKEIEKLSQYYCLLSPDFSIFTNMPMALQIESVFKNRWCGAYWQSKGLKVIPTVSWGDEKSFDFCFDGIEEGSIVAVCTYYRENCEEEFMLGYNEMMKRIKPSVVICYDEPFKSMTGNIKEFLPTTYEWTKDLSLKDLIQFKWEKHNRNVSGLDKKDFQFFDYDDPYVKDQMVKCSICGSGALQDQYGNGECKNCGWKFSKDEKMYEEKMGISYPMLVSPTTAREQYKKGLPFKATFEEFVNGLFFYSEMLLTYKDIMYEVFLKPDNSIVFCSKDMQQEYKTRQDFENKANINGTLLKELWKDVSFAGFMYCG